MDTILPAYYQIKQTIKNWIINKEFSLGEKIPSENELASQFNVNRLTVRQGIGQLVQEGFLTAIRGKGTFVTTNEQLINSYNLEFTGFVDDLFHEIQKTKTISVKLREITVPKFLANKLALSKKCKDVVQIKRVRYRENRSFAYTVNYLPVELGRKMTESALTRKPLLQIMEQDLGIQFTEAFQTIEATFAELNIAEKLEIPSGSPVLYIERIMYTKGRRPVEFVQTSYRGDRYRYIVRLKTEKRRQGSTWIHQST